MYALTVYRTRDGVLHDTAAAAGRHADNQYGLKLSSLAHAAVKIDKYTGMCDFFDAHLNDFAELQALADDIKLVDSTED